jgi:hypothetical protein
MFSRRPLRVLLALTSLAAIAGCASGSAEREAQDEVRHALDTIVRERQASYFVANGTYTADVAALSLTNALPQKIRVRISSADANGWSAAATHASLPVTPCTLYVGSPPTYAALPTPSGVRAANVGAEGAVQCASLGS